MINISDDFKRKVVNALLEARKLFDGGDIPFSQKHGIQASVFSRLKNGELDKLLNNGKWITLGRELGVATGEKKWNLARTDVFTTIEADVMFCQDNSKSRIYVDECGIGKTFTAKYLSRTLKNCFYVDASQCKTKQAFIREIAKAVGVDHKDKYCEVKANLKYWLTIVTLPVVIIDEAGDLEYTAFLELKELWNATEGACGWYLMGADGLRHNIEKGISNKKVGYRELFSRFSENYSSAVPNGKEQRQAFYARLIGQVLDVNMEDKTEMYAIVKACLTPEKSGKDGKDNTNQIGGLRRAESLYLLSQHE